MTSRSLSLHHHQSLLMMKLKAIWAKQHSLAEIVDPSNFKSYEDLKSKLDMVLQGASKVPTASTVCRQSDIEDDLFAKPTF